MKDQIYKYLLTNTKFDLPESVVADQSAQLLRRQYANMLIRGMTTEQVQEEADKLKAVSDEQAKEQLRVFFIMEKLADRLGVSVSEEEINGKIAEIAIRRGRRPEKVREEMSRDGSLVSLGMQLREEKCLEKLLASAKITETKAAPDKQKLPRKKVPSRKAGK
jgi:trigger factor